MLFTITYTGENASDLGYLLHKNPRRPQTAELNFGRVHVFYPEIESNRCTAALLLDIDPLDLVRGRQGSKPSAGNGLFEYVNDRPYVASSFMSTAISRVYGTAMAGNCEQRQALADTPLDLMAKLVMLPCRGDTAMLKNIFTPLGYEAEFSGGILDEQFPEWGQSRYVNLTLRGKVRLRDLLRHLYVLIPVFDRRKHYYVGEDEIDKLLSHGEGWLEEHPARAFITHRYFKNLGNFTRIALNRLNLDRLDNGEAGAAEAPADEPAEDDAGEKVPHKNLNTRRLEAVLAALKESGAKSVIDLGCGEGNLLKLLIREKSFTRIAGTDVSLSALERAEKRLKPDRLSETQKQRLSLFQSSVTYQDKRFRGYAAAAAVEVMEHLDENRLGAFAAILLGDARPKTLVITTPNIEYNENYVTLKEGRFRHEDHRFEWTREQFHAWADAAAGRYGYSARFEEIGDRDEERGTPTQMGVFTLCE
jgi:3' terminal RNA ribose 2'-O-methyltransferase Hen1